MGAGATFSCCCVLNGRGCGPPRPPPRGGEEPSSGRQPAGQGQARGWGRWVAPPRGSRWRLAARRGSKPRSVGPTVPRPVTGKPGLGPPKDGRGRSVSRRTAGRAGPRPPPRGSSHPAGPGCRAARGASPAPPAPPAPRQLAGSRGGWGGAGDAGCPARPPGVGPRGPVLAPPTTVGRLRRPGVR